MSQSFSDIYVHIVFSTYGRVKCLSPSLAPQIWKYLAGICHALNCPALEIGGTDDHVHILCKLSNDITVQDLVKKLKSSSSKWLKKNSPEILYFNWQRGYGTFSVSSSNKGIVASYINNQHHHHRAISFEEELITLLKKCNIEYDEKYLWD